MHNNSSYNYDPDMYYYYNAFNDEYDAIHGSMMWLWYEDYEEGDA